MSAIVVMPLETTFCQVSERGSSCYFKEKRGGIQNACDTVMIRKREDAEYLNLFDLHYGQCLPLQFILHDV